MQGRRADQWLLCTPRCSTEPVTGKRSGYHSICHQGKGCTAELCFGEGIHWGEKNNQPHTHTCPQTLFSRYKQGKSLPWKCLQGVCCTCSDVFPSIVRKGKGEREGHMGTYRRFRNSSSQYGTKNLPLCANYKERWG